jgi:hypothetical protein
MDNVQNCDSYINIPSSQTYTRLPVHHMLLQLNLLPIFAVQYFSRQEVPLGISSRLFVFMYVSTVNWLVITVMLSSFCKYLLASRSPRSCLVSQLVLLPIIVQVMYGERLSSHSAMFSVFSRDAWSCDHSFHRQMRSVHYWLITMKT